LPDGWEVRVGRDDADNDALTHRFARPDDVWLHASGVAGSHVVLRMHGRDGNPPRTVLEAAAALAARFSKAKHAGTVPVIWTRKRYVRKPRGGAPGVAVCTHEKTLFVRPALPETVETED
jgi:predicted ribosome quality control (RQC) complex YloA/Tae2 family protein